MIALPACGNGRQASVQSNVRSDGNAPPCAEPSVSPLSVYRARKPSLPVALVHLRDHDLLTGVAEMSHAATLQSLAWG